MADVTEWPSADSVTGWNRSVGYALDNACKRWREDGNPGEPGVEFLKAWLPYYLHQQAECAMLPRVVAIQEKLRG